MQRFNSSNSMSYFSMYVILLYVKFKSVSIASAVKIYCINHVPRKEVVRHGRCHVEQYVSSARLNCTIDFTKHCHVIIQLYVEKKRVKYPIKKESSIRQNLYYINYALFLKPVTFINLMRKIIITHVCLHK